MNQKINPYMLGATMYMPATRLDIVTKLVGQEIKDLSSVVICLEDAVSENEVEFALNNLKKITAELAEAKRCGNKLPLIFIRPRHLEMAEQIVRDYDLSAINGVVIPKFTLADLESWWGALRNTHLLWMPTLETRDVFSVNDMEALAKVLDTHGCKDKILALRIGGNDLMNCISLRRPRDMTLYDGPMGYVIKMLVAVMSPYGFAMTAPVCEHIDNHEILEKEWALDMAHGLVGKTAIHPNQIQMIQQPMMVSKSDYQDALHILNSEKAVFKSNGAMCEPATHKNWAKSILARSNQFGISSPVNHDVVQFAGNEVSAKVLEMAVSK